MKIKFKRYNNFERATVALEDDVQDAIQIGESDLNILIDSSFSICPACYSETKNIIETDNEKCSKCGYVVPDRVKKNEKKTKRCNNAKGILKDLNMTLNEAKQFDFTNSDINDIYEHIDHIFYDVESKSCNNCYWNSIVEKGMCNLLKIEGMEYCSRFEQKKER